MNGPPDELHDIVLVCLTEADQATTARLHAEALRTPALAARLERVRAMLHTLTHDDGADPPPECIRRAQQLMPPHTHPAHGPAQPTLLHTLARLVHDTLAGTPAPGFRGGPRVRHLLFRGELGEIDLRIEAAPNTPSRILGQIDPDLAPGARVFLISASTQTRTPLAPDPLGVFSAAIPPGPCTLRVESADRSMATPEFDA